MPNKFPLVVCFAGGPGSGKSTTAASVFATLKKMNINAELVTEYAKDKTWEGNMCALRCQEYVFGKQSYKLARCRDDVDVIVTDSPLFLGLMYNHNPALDEHFDQLVMNVFNSYNNMVYFVNRVKPYNPKGRNQTEDESNKIAEETKDLMKRFNIPYVEINGDSSGEERVVSDILARLNQMELDFKLSNTKATVIDSFSGDYEFLSNFYPSPIPMYIDDNSVFMAPTVEHYFQGMKTLSDEECFSILAAKTPGEAKRLGRKCQLRPDWETVKNRVMLDAIRLKFRDPEFKKKLLATGDAELIEGNTWGDKYWGMVNRVGENQLGRILMEVREELRNESQN